MVKAMGRFISSLVVVSTTTAVIITGVILWAVGLSAPCWLLTDFEQYSTPGRIAAMVLVLSWVVGWVAATAACADARQLEVGTPSRAPAPKRPNAPPNAPTHPPRKRVTVGEA